MLFTVAAWYAETCRLLFTFRVSRRRREMYIGHARLYVCLSVPRPIPALLDGPGYNLGQW